jgi:transposase
MGSEKRGRRAHLEQAGLLNPKPERVRDVLFLSHPEFFDAHDLLQVRYELLRAHLVDDGQIVGLCDRYGVSRQTFYNLLAKFIEHGSGGLIPRKPGPKGASKVTSEVLKFAVRRLEKDADLSGGILASEIEDRFATTLHPRTTERLLRRLRSKKNG